MIVDEISSFLNNIGDKVAIEYIGQKNP